MSVLLTSAGRRAYLVRYFQEARDLLGGAGKVVVANTDLDAPAAQVADHAVRVPASWDPAYVPTILQICHEHSIRLLCSLHDLDTYFLAPHAPTLRQAGVVPMLPDSDWSRRTLDKMECSRYLQAQGFDVPWTDTSLQNAQAAIARKEIDFPLLIKARHGFGSLGLTRCHSLDELNWYFQRTQKQLEQHPLVGILSESSKQLVLIQQEVSGQEYCVDVVNDLKGEYAAHFVGEVHGMRAGETDQLTTVSTEPLGHMVRRVSRLTRHLGIWGLDLIVEGNRNWVVDVNPRFTGDYPFQHLAGANVPATLLGWLSGRAPHPDWLRPEIGVRGYKDLVPTRTIPLQPTTWLPRREAA